MTEEPISNPNPTASDPHPINGGATPPNGEAVVDPNNAGAAASAAPRQLEGKDIVSYLLLRQCIDVFQTNALAHYASGKTVEARAIRTEEVRDHVAKFKNDFSPDGCGPHERRLADGTCAPNDGMTAGTAGGGGDEA